MAKGPDALLLVLALAVGSAALHVADVAVPGVAVRLDPSEYKTVILKSGDSCLAANADDVVQQGCNEGLTRRWTFIGKPDTLAGYQIKSLSQGDCIRPAEGFIVLTACADSDFAQRWFVDDVTPKNTFRLRNTRGKCLAFGLDGNPIFAKCKGSATVLTIKNPVEGGGGAIERPAGPIMIRSKLSDLCITINMKTSELFQGPCGKPKNTNVFLLDYRDRVVRTKFAISTTNEGICLDTTPRKKRPANAIHRSLCKFGIDAQIFAFVDFEGAKTTMLRSEDNGRCITIKKASKKRGAVLRMLKCVGSPEQRWVFSDVTGDPVTPEVEDPEMKPNFPDPSWFDNPPALMMSIEYGKCMTLEDAEDGTVLTLQKCTGSRMQLVAFRPMKATGQYQMIFEHSNKCLMGQRNGMSRPVVQDKCRNADMDQRVQVELKASNPLHFQLRFFEDDLCAVPTLHLDRVKLKPCGTLKQVNLWTRMNTEDANPGPNPSPDPTPVPPPTGGLVPHSKVKWSPVMKVDLIPVAAANIPGGDLMFWSAEAPFDYRGGTKAATLYGLLNPKTGKVVTKKETSTEHDMFCPGISMLFDGSLAVTGGKASKAMSTFKNGDWKKGPPMKLGRGYQTMIVLSTGDLYVQGGSWSGGIGGKTPELFKGGMWRILTGVDIKDFEDSREPDGAYRSDNHADLFAWKSKTVFHAGPSRDMFWISPYDNGGDGKAVYAGKRGDDNYAMNSNAVMYEQGKILVVGGAPGYVGPDSTKNAHIIDINDMRKVTVKKISPMKFHRTMHNSVVTPNGQVIVIGGLFSAKIFTDNMAMMQPELFDPNTMKFRPLPAMKIPRTYHSVALLLPDARIFVGGGGLCGDCSANHPDYQILTPPYLLKEDGSSATRPEIASAAKTAGLGDKIRVKTAEKPEVAAFSVIRLSTVTHAINSDQRRISLSFKKVSETAFDVVIPEEPGVVIPGFYWLYCLTKNGVPSVGHEIRITP